MANPSKVILVFCDGTGQDGLIACDMMEDQTIRSATNVLRLSRAINPSKTLSNGNKIPQIVYYQSGVGTESDFRTEGNKLESLIQAYGRVVASKIRDVYVFIAQNYLPGDEICLFGYSRGAYTVRKVAGLIDRIGILSRRDLGQFSDIWRRLNDNQYNGPRPSTPVKVKCVGVWDTVGSVSVFPNRGIIDALSIKDCSLPACIENALHAIAFHENRTPMIPTLWNSSPKAGQNLKQMWFAGSHAGVGGGMEARELADIALFWMASEIEGFVSIDRNILWASHVRSPKAGWGAAQPYNSFENETALRAIGSTTRLPLFSRGIPTQLHESMKNSPPKLTQPRNMITLTDVPSSRRPAYAPLGTLETELKNKWVATGNSNVPTASFESQPILANLFRGLAGQVFETAGNVVRGVGKLLPGGIF